MFFLIVSNEINVKNDGTLRPIMQIKNDKNNSQIIIYNNKEHKITNINTFTINMKKIILDNFKYF